MRDFKNLEQTYEFDVYPKRDLVLIRGKNAKAWDSEGNEYIDCVAGHGVANIGHCNDRVIEAIETQAKQLISCSGTFHNDTRALLLEKLIGIAPNNLKRAFLCNSGAETIEAAIKFARFTTKRKEFVCGMRGFHGRTMGALSATFTPEYRKDFEPIVEGFHYVPFNNFGKLAEKVNDNTAAVILEPVQGEGGVNIGNREYFAAVRRLCEERKVLLILDEVQTGFCRTGKMFACNHFDLSPDIMCVAKGIAGGLPMGAVLCSDQVEAPMGKHGSTFGGNPLSCAAAIAAIDYMMENRLDEQAREKGEHFVDKLKSSLPVNVREIRHLGLMIGIELKEKSTPHILKLIEKGVLALPAGPTVLRFLPPLTISHEELDFVAQKVMHVLAANS
ncbi:MAG: acetylornithine/succinylornithine family transaminase [Candidatus Binatia bacterium]|jgi:acetylornithine/LysW-gamma-L-lysine aminotransferase|nr:acetylornithine/succinylornithine family transaminase [Candidatus Binatia bacterium]